MHLNLTSLQGSELAGWALGRYSYEWVDMNHNFPDLNNIMWDAKENDTDVVKTANHYIPIPEYYTKEDAFVSTVHYTSTPPQSMTQHYVFSFIFPGFTFVFFFHS